MTKQQKTFEVILREKMAMVQKIEPLLILLAVIVVVPIMWYILPHITVWLSNCGFTDSEILAILTFGAIPLSWSGWKLRTRTYERPDRPEAIAIAKTKAPMIVKSQGQINEPAIKANDQLPMAVHTPVYPSHPNAIMVMAATVRTQLKKISAALSNILPSLSRLLTKVYQAVGRGSTKCKQNH
jgi:hypothetical protein